MTNNTFRLGELFCGPGGIGYAANRATISDTTYRITHQWANDMDPDSIATFSDNVLGSVHDTRAVLGDVRTLNFRVLHDLGDIDALSFGFPCNDFSRAGKSKGLEGDFGPLYTYGIKALTEFKPKFFLAENVGGLSSNKEGEVFNKILQEMREAGYRITPHLYKFEQYGVPQNRHRIIIVGIREDLPYTFCVPSPAPYADVDVSARTALADIPTWASHNDLAPQTPLVTERLSLIKPGENVFTADLPEHLQIKTNTKLSLMYRRLLPDRPAYTVTGSAGGGTYMYHWEEPRALTNRERARLQTFPDTYIFHGNRNSVRKQIGMAVPPAGAQVIFEAILSTFASIPYESIPSSFPSD